MNCARLTCIGFKRGLAGIEKIDKLRRRRRRDLAEFVSQTSDNRIHKPFHGAPCDSRHSTELKSAPACRAVARGNIARLRPAGYGAAPRLTMVGGDGFEPPTLSV